MEAAPDEADPGEASSEAADSSDPRGAYLVELRAAEDELMGEGLRMHSPEALRAAVRTLIDVILGREDGQHAEGLHARLETALSRWSRRKARRNLEDGRAEAIAELDFETWRSDLRMLASCVALDRTGGDLRAAFVALLDSSEAGDGELSENDDISTIVEGSKLACGLRKRVVIAWCALLARAIG